MARPTRALIDLAALRHNCALAQSLAPGASTLAVVKSNAYGHGAPAVARALEGVVQAFGVACIEEALERAWSMRANFVCSRRWLVAISSISLSALIQIRTMDLMVSMG